jgi:hypothetical protein
MTYLDQTLSQVCDCEFPVSRVELLDRCGDVKIKTPNGGSRTLEEIMSVCDDSPDEFASARELRNHIYCLAPEDFVGRVNYDDRGHTYQNKQQVSF